MDDDPTLEDDRLTCWGCKAKWEGSPEEARQFGWEYHEDEFYCDLCVDAWKANRWAKKHDW